MKEYKIITQKRRFFRGTFDQEELSRKLNEMGKKGWAVISSLVDGAKAFGQSKEMIIILEREL